MKGKAEPDGEETWSLLQCWTDLVPLLRGDAHTHVAMLLNIHQFGFFPILCSRHATMRACLFA